MSLTTTALVIARPETPQSTTTIEASKKPPRWLDGAYLAGPIPWSWLTQAGALTGKSCQLGLALWREARIHNNLTVAINQSKTARQFGAGRASMQRALLALESAGLVQVVERKPGRRVRVRIALEGISEQLGH